MKKTEEKPEEENCLVWALDHLYKTWPELREMVRLEAGKRLPKTEDQSESKAA